MHKKSRRILFSLVIVAAPFCAIYVFRLLWVCDAEKELVERLLPRVQSEIEFKMRSCPLSQRRYPVLDHLPYESKITGYCSKFDYYLEGHSLLGVQGHVIVYSATLPSGRVFVATHTASHLVVSPLTFEYAFLFGHSAIWWFFDHNARLPATLKELEGATPYLTSIEELRDEHGRLPFYEASGEWYAYFGLGKDAMVSADDEWSPTYGVMDPGIFNRIPPYQMLPQDFYARNKGEQETPR